MSSDSASLIECLAFEGPFALLDQGTERRDNKTHSLALRDVTHE